MFLNVSHGCYEDWTHMKTRSVDFVSLRVTRQSVHFQTQRGGRTAASVRCAHTHTPWPLSPASPLTRAVWFHYIGPNCVRCSSTCSGRNTRQERLQGHRSRGDVKAFIHTLSESSLFQTSAFLPLQGWGPDLWPRCRTPQRTAAATCGWVSVEQTHSPRFIRDEFVDVHRLILQFFYTRKCNKTEQTCVCEILTNTNTFFNWM